jgi:hypothetical protein
LANVHVTSGVRDTLAFSDDETSELEVTGSLKTSAGFARTEAGGDQGGHHDHGDYNLDSGRNCGHLEIDTKRKELEL